MNFSQASREAGLLNFMYEIRPSLAADRVLSASKFLAKQLAGGGYSPGHRNALETIAHTCGFGDWHALQTLCKRLIEAEAEIEDSSKIEALIGAIPLLVSVKVDVPADNKIQKTLAMFSENLAIKLKANPADIRDCVASLFGGLTWHTLCTRHPVDSSSPLYTFVVEPPTYFEESTIGRFVWSSACAALVEELDDLWQDYGNRPISDKLAARKFVIQALDKRPDFLEGWLALASMNREDESRDWMTESKRCFEEGINRAEALIPDDFKGKIEWGYIDNRFYHRLLVFAMQHYTLEGKLRKAIALARKQLRLNPTDNLGIRYVLPPLLAASGQADATQAALKKLAKPYEGFVRAEGAFVFSLCHFALKQPVEGVRYFLQALLTVPPIRQFIQMKPAPSHQDRDAWRGVIPDFSSMVEGYLVVIKHTPRGTLPFEAILRDSTVLRLEAAAATLYLQAKSAEDFSVRQDKFNIWKDFIQERCLALAPELAKSL